MDNYEFRPITPDNLADVVWLVKTVGNKRLSVDYYRKKYATPWADGRYHGWLAYEKVSGQVVSVSAALPLRAVLPDGSEVRLTQMIETFTLPAHRGKGLMTLLTQKILSDHQAQGTHLFFGLLNQNNVHGFVKKLGFTHTGTMWYYRLPVRTFPLEALCRKAHIPGLFRWWAQRVWRPFLAPEGFVLGNSVPTEGFVGVLHNVDFFRYKSFTFNALCRFSGVDAWLKLDSGLLVGDVQLAPDCTDAQVDQWLATLQRLARRAGVRQIVFQTYTESRLHQKLSVRLPAHASWSVCCLASSPDTAPLLTQLRFGYGDFETF